MGVPARADNGRRGSPGHLDFDVIGRQHTRDLATSFGAGFLAVLGASDKLTALVAAAAYVIPADAHRHSAHGHSAHGHSARGH